MNAHEHAIDAIPILVASDGQPYIGCDAAVLLLRAIAAACRTNAEDPEVDFLAAAEAIDQEADALAVRAIAHTT